MHMYILHRCCVVWVVFFLSICFVIDVCHSGLGDFKSYGVTCM